MRGHFDIDAAQIGGRDHDMERVGRRERRFDGGLLARLGRLLVRCNAIVLGDRPLIVTMPGNIRCSLVYSWFTIRSPRSEEPSIGM